MNVLRKLWTDEAGVILSAEMVMLGTVAVLATSAGVGVLSNAVSDELAEMAMAVRAFDQSVAVSGYTLTQGGGSRGAQAASTRGSSYVQGSPSIAQEHVRQTYRTVRLATAGALGARGVVLTDQGLVVEETEDGRLQVRQGPKIRSLVTDPETGQLKIVD
jgi:hypothetical protein